MKYSLFDHKTIKWLSFFVLLIPVVVYLVVFILSLVNFPFYDDFFWYNKLILQAQGQSLADKLHLITQQHSDHRLIFLKGSALIMASIGPFDFRWPILLSNSIFFLFSAHLVVSIYRLTRHWLLAVPCLFILYQFLPFTVVYSYGLQTLGVLLLLYFTFYYVWQSDRIGYFLTGLSAILCVLTNTNGLIVLPILAILYSLTHRFRAALFYGLLTIIIITAYFSGDYRWNAGTISGIPLQNRLVESYLFLAELLGSYVNISLVYGRTLAQITGSLVLLFTGWSLWYLLRQIDWKRWYIPQAVTATDGGKHLFLTAICMLGFILLTCIVLTQKRYSGIDLPNNIVPHYQQYSSFALCFCYVCGLMLVINRQWKWPYVITCTLLTMAVNFVSYMYIHRDLRFHTLSLRADTYNWQNNHLFLFFPLIEGEQAWKTITKEMEESYSKGLIAPPPSIKQDLLIPGRLPATTNPAFDGLQVTVTEPDQKLSYLRTAFLVLRDSQNSYFFPYINQINAPRVMLRKHSLINTVGQSAISKHIPDFVLPQGTYQAFLFDEDQQTIQQLDTLIEIPVD